MLLLPRLERPPTPILRQRLLLRGPVLLKGGRSKVMKRVQLFRRNGGGTGLRMLVLSLPLSMPKQMLSLS